MNSKQTLAPAGALFNTFFIGGFECSCHRNRSRKRLDLLASTQHDNYLLKDYLRLQQYHISTARTGIRWHLIETSPGRYDFSTVLPMLQAARQTGMQLIWDLCHYGWPDDLDIFSPEFIQRYKGLVTAFAKLLRDETETIPFLCPMNEISYFAWAGADQGLMNPFQKKRGHELKRQLVRTTVEAIEAIWQILPQARLIQPEPAIHIIPNPKRPHERKKVENHCQAQYQAWDMLCGRLEPELGGAEKYLDIIGINYYYHNQWIAKGPTLNQRHPLYKPFRQILQENYERYGRPMFIAETGAEGEARADWLSYVCSEVRAALEAGLPIHGICLYPILNHLGWEDDRHCPNGLWDHADATGDRAIYEPLARELRRQQRLFAQMETKKLDSPH
jgi:beta-glucosidase/6-phospho-beta-glucosidase/beta-galactosidase